MNKNLTTSDIERWRPDFELVCEKITGMLNATIDEDLPLDYYDLIEGAKGRYFLQGHAETLLNRNEITWSQFIAFKAFMKWGKRCLN